LPAKTGSTYLEVARRHGDYALAGVCCTVTLDGGEAITEARLCYCGVATRPVRATVAEELLRGQPPGEALFADAGKAARDVVDVGDDYAAPSDYRRQLVASLAVR